MRRRILLCFAHPDDESFYTAGTLLRYRETGVSATLCCATRGQRGSAGDPPVCTTGELATVRERELHAAAAILGIEEIELLSYEDQQLASAPVDRIRSELVAMIRRVRPDVLITFDAFGGSGHTDHQAISRFTLDAALAAADRRWESGGAPFTIPRLLWTPPVQPWRLERASALCGGIDFFLDNEQWAEGKRQALLAHRTQNKGVRRTYLGAADSLARLRFEAFRQVWGPPVPETPTGDIFEGLP